jgi:hypothetical protein
MEASMPEEPVAPAVTYAVHYVPADTGQMVNFWKNLAMAGAFAVGRVGRRSLELEPASARARP